MQAILLKLVSSSGGRFGVPCNMVWATVSDVPSVRRQRGDSVVTRKQAGTDFSAVLKDSPHLPADNVSDGEFDDLIEIIEQARVNAFRAVNQPGGEQLK